MTDLKDFFENKTDNVYFLELKDKDFFKYPLPILKSDFIEELRNESFSEEIDLDYFFRGMMYISAVDNEFIYKNDYINFIKDKVEKPESYLMNISMREVNENFENSLIFFKFINENFYSNASGFAYASALKDAFDKTSNLEFLKESKKILNHNISSFPNYPYNYILFGTIEMLEDNPVKSELYLRKALELSIGNNFELEIREKIVPLLEEVAINSTIEQAHDFLLRGKFKEVINLLKDLNSLNYKKYHYMAMSYYNLGDGNKALDLFKEVFNESEYPNDVNFHMDYSFVLAQMGFVKESLSIINQALDKIGESAPLLFNRAVIFINIGLFEKAKEDLENVVSYYDISEELFNNSMILLEKLKN